MTKTLHKHHIIPKHAGGTDDPSNIVELTIDQHAEAHRILWEKHGRWEDELAYKGLAGLMSKQDIVARQLSEAGKKGGSAKPITYDSQSPGGFANYEKNKDAVNATLRANATRAKGKKGKEFGGARRKWMWCHNGVENKKILADSDLPEGYIKGRLTSWQGSLA